MLHGQQPRLPMLQVLNTKEVKGQTCIRYVVVMSDGKHWTEAMMGMGYSHLFESSAIQKNCFVEVSHYVVHHDVLVGCAKHDILIINTLASVLYTEKEERVGQAVKYSGEDDNKSLYQPTDSNTDDSSVALSIKEACAARFTEYQLASFLAEIALLNK